MNFKKAIEAKRKAAKAAPPLPKPVSEMSEAELATEEARLREEIRRSRERSVEAGREAVAAESGGEGGSLQAFLATRRRKARRSWK